MATQSKCFNCPRDAYTKGMCERCYQYERRTGKLPPAELLRSMHGSSQLTIALPDELREKAEAAATASESRSLGQWIRSAMRSQLSEDKAQKKASRKRSKPRELVQGMGIVIQRKQ